MAPKPVDIGKKPYTQAGHECEMEFQVIVLTEFELPPDWEEQRRFGPCEMRTKRHALETGDIVYPAQIENDESVVDAQTIRGSIDECGGNERTADPRGASLTDVVIPLIGCPKSFRTLPDTFHSFVQ